MRGYTFNFIDITIAICIIGILAAITIPNVIAYRNRQLSISKKSDKPNVTKIETKAVSFISQLLPTYTDWIAICKNEITPNTKWSCTLSGINPSTDRRVLISVQYTTSYTIPEQEGFFIDQVHRNP